jgi:hypothetical protein
VWWKGLTGDVTGVALRPSDPSSMIHYYEVTFVSLREHSFKTQNNLCFILCLLQKIPGYKFIKIKETSTQGPACGHK